MPDKKPHARNLRLGRIALPNNVYHLTTRTHRRKPLFRNFAAARLLAIELNNQQVRTLTYVVMPDHFHWLIELPKDVSLSNVMNCAKGKSSRRINQSLNRTGVVWQAGYFDRAVRFDDDLVAVARYIVANPLRAGLVSKIGQYPHWDAEWLSEFDRW